MCCKHLPIKYEFLGPDKALPKESAISTPGAWRRAYGKAISTFSRFSLLPRYKTDAPVVCMQV